MKEVYIKNFLGRGYPFALIEKAMQKLPRMMEQEQEQKSTNEIFTQRAPTTTTVGQKNGA